ncbi:MAG: hypothetical protein HY926_11185 [Elusimicrobia bacterium]|nr:hypothetical protein [Elusimicrobiota bacterium]
MRPLLVFLTLGLAAAAHATPSGQVLIPSTDLQPYKVLHLNFDSFIRTQDENDGRRLGPMVMAGPTIGVLPYDKVRAEAGFDLLYKGVKELDNNPLYFHGKVGTPEKSLHEWSPALALGVCNIGTKDGLTNQDMVYGLAARSIPKLGRLSFGWYGGNGAALRDEQNRVANHGALASWDRTMEELSKKLWCAVDYQGGQNVMGAANLGCSWAFSEKTSVILGYDIWNNRAVAGKNTFNLQVDINF